MPVQFLFYTFFVFSFFKLKCSEKYGGSGDKIRIASFLFCPVQRFIRLNVEGIIIILRPGQNSAKADGKALFIGHPDFTDSLEQALAFISQRPRIPYPFHVYDKFIPAGTPYDIAFPEAVLEDASRGYGLPPYGRRYH